MYNFSNVTTLYISAENGSDINMGFLPEEDGLGNGPLQTFKFALMQIANLRRVGMLQPITLKIMDSEVFVPETIVIDESVCGLTIEPYDMEKRTTITGSKKLTGFYESEFNGHKCFAVNIPEVKEGKWSFADLYVDGERAQLPRYPETGHIIPKQVEVKTKVLHEGSKWFIANDGDLDGIQNVEDCYLSFTHFWVDEHTPIESFDRKTNKVTLKYRSGYHCYSESPEDSSTMEYYLENVPEKFSKPNQWYLDKKEGILYYIPKNNSQTVDNISVYAPVISMLVDIHGDAENGKKANNIRFRNIDFRYTDGGYYSDQILDTATMHTENVEPKATDGQSANKAPGTIRFIGAHGCFMENCSVKNFGHYGVSIEDGCDNIHILGNTFYDGGAGGIKINGADAEGEAFNLTYGNEISDNEISFCGRKYFAGCGVLLMHSFENTVSHNDIHDLFYSGISVGWVWGYKPTVCRDNIIEKNHIYNLGDGLLSDMGGIYLLGYQPGTIVRGNLIHDVNARHYGGWGIYTDEGSSYITVENNICYNFSNNAYHQHFGSMNTVRNNIFAFSTDGILRVSRPEMHLSIIFERNIVVADNSPMYAVNYHGQFNHAIAGSKNVFYDYGRDKTYLMESDTVQAELPEFSAKHNMDCDSVVADPLFKDAENRDFTLSPNSPAIKLGFVPFNLNDAGVRK